MKVPTVIAIIMKVLTVIAIVISLQCVRVWCDGKQYTPHTSSAGNSPSAEGDADSPSNEVLLPLSRDEGSTALVVAAQLPGAAGASGSAGKECVVMFKDFRCDIIVGGCIPTTKVAC
jgi:hypothetical protein